MAERTDVPWAGRAPLPPAPPLWVRGDVTHPNGMRTCSGAIALPDETHPENWRLVAEEAPCTPAS